MHSAISAREERPTWTPTAAARVSAAIVAAALGLVEAAGGREEEERLVAVDAGGECRTVFQVDAPQTSQP